MSVIKMGLVSGRGVDLGKITEGKGKAQWLAVTNSNFDNESTILAYGYANEILPVPYVSTHPIYPVMLCRGIRVYQDRQAPRKWEIDATYSSQPLTGPEKDQTVNPVNRPAKIKWRTQAYRKAVDKDINGRAIVNSAGDYFDPPPEADRSHWVAMIRKNVTAVPAAILGYDNPVNSKGFTIQGLTVAPKVAKLLDIEISDLQVEGEYEFYTFDYALEFRPAGWNLKPLDQGYRYKSGSDRKNILDNSTPPRPVTSPRLLDGAGNVLANPTTSNAVFLDYEIDDAKDFSILPGLDEFP